MDPDVAEQKKIKQEEEEMVNKMSQEDIEGIVALNVNNNNNKDNISVIMHYIRIDFEIVT